MKRIAIYLGLATALVASCSVQEKDVETPQKDETIFYASFEQPTEAGTRVYSNEDLLLRWTADDRVSIFNKIDYNQQYRFTGATGDNAGGFRKVDADEFITGSTIPHIVSVYPYQETTAISQSEVISITLPAEQHYAENTFGLGANTMVSISEDNLLQFKNIGGYLRLRLYGAGVSVKSITLKGNNGEKLSGNATVTMPLDGTPSVTLAQDATASITLVCDTPVVLGATAEESVEFWFVVPPVTFRKGFTVTVSGEGGVFKQSTSKTLTISRSNLSKMSPIEVSLSRPNNMIFYKTSDGKILRPQTYSFGANLVSNEYVDGQGILTFDDDVTTVGDMTFFGCSLLTDIDLPESVMSIGYAAFMECSNLTAIRIPSGVTEIKSQTFDSCSNLARVEIPAGLTGIGQRAFYCCSSIADITLPESVFEIGLAAFYECVSLSHISIPAALTSVKQAVFKGCSNLEEVNVSANSALTSVEGSAFENCSSLTGFEIPSGVTSIGYSAFSNCTSLTGIDIPAGVKVIDRGAFFNCSSITGVVIPEGVTVISQGCFQNCTSLTSLAIPSSVTTIQDSAFDNCTSLTRISIPEDGALTTIGAKAFQHCTSLVAITIPCQVARIGNGAFSQCYDVAKITVYPPIPPEGGSQMFYGSGNGPIYVPAESVGSYKTASYWSVYADRIYAMPIIGAPAGYELDWSNEFDGQGTPSTDGWWYETGGGGWGNNESQVYVAGSREGENLAFISDGTLKIQAKKMGRTVYSVRMNTIRSWTYGWFEVRMKTADASGAHTALWMMPKNFGSWPEDGEIDLMDYAVNTLGKNKIASSIHCGSYNYIMGTQKTHVQTVENASSEFHVYALEWTADKIAFFVDGLEHYSFANDGRNNYDTWPFDTPFYLKMNLAWGGTMGGTTDETALPATCEIDYVRVYQRQ